MNNTPSLDTLLSPLTWAEFVECAYGRKPLHLKGAADRFRKHFSRSDLDNILNSTVQPHPELKLFRNGKPVSAGSFCAVKAAVREGATLILENVDRYHARLAQLLDEITAETWIPARFNMYLSQVGTMGYTVHYDTHDFLILQVEGYKEWLVYPPTVDSPIYFDRIHGIEPPAESQLLMRTVLEPGDVLYVPRGFWHGATATQSASLHLTLALFMRTGVEFMQWLLDELRSFEVVRRALPLIQPQQGVVSEESVQSWLQHVGLIRARIDALLSDPRTIRRFMRDHFGNQTARRPFNFAAGDSRPATGVYTFKPRRVPTVLDTEEGTLSLFGQNIHLATASPDGAALLREVMSGTGNSRCLAEKFGLDEQEVCEVMDTLSLHGAGDMQLQEV